MSSKIIDNLVSSAKNGSAEAFGELLKTTILFGSETLSTENYMKQYGLNSAEYIKCLFIVIKIVVFVLIYMILNVQVLLNISYPVMIIKDY